jgi:hypothetical protein
MIRVRDIVSALLSSVWRVAVPVVGVCFLVGTFFKGNADLEGIEPSSKGRAVVSDHSAHVLVKTGEAETDSPSVCVVQDDGGKELGRITFFKAGTITFEFGSSSALRGCGVLRRDGGIDLGVSTDVRHRYLVSVGPDGSSVVEVLDQAGGRHRTLRVSPQGDMLGDRPGS